ncbi:MAG: HAD hydrolase-like protein [Pseudomonadota bacterium]
MAQLKLLDGFTVVFDLDGTLVDTAPDLIGALNQTLTNNGLNSVPDMAVSDLIGSGARTMIKAGLSHQNIHLPEGRIDNLFETFLEIYIENIAVRSRPYEGCEAALSRLTGAGATLVVCTNKKQNLADELLEALDMARWFKSVVGADSVPNRKPDPGHLLSAISGVGGDRSRAVMVGDSVTDERAAHSAELPFILCPFGYGPIEVEPLGRRVSFSTYADFSAELVLRTASS